MPSFYSDERNTVKVWNKSAMNVVRRMLLNAYILYDQITADTPHLSRLQFTHHVVEQQAPSNKQRHTSAASSQYVKFYYYFALLNETKLLHVFVLYIGCIIILNYCNHTFYEQIMGQMKDCSVCSNRRSGNRRRACKE